MKTDMPIPQRTQARTSEVLAQLKKLHRYVVSATSGNCGERYMFNGCFRASFSKCYEFNLYAWNERNADGAVFALPTLRGICEELIFLNFLQQVDAAQRDELLVKLLVNEMHVRLEAQQSFFAKLKPLQPVLRPLQTPAVTKTQEEEIRNIWRANGWPNMNRGVLPAARQVAEKDGGDVLATLYDFLYRLTSGTVHFTVGGLLRTGWGNMPDCTFSVGHFTGYYVAFARIYGAFLFCVYFELFSNVLHPSKAAQKHVDTIRKVLQATVRWPEMITFEEMNVPVPDPGILINALGIVIAQESKTLLTLAPQVRARRRARRSTT